MTNAEVKERLEQVLQGLGDNPAQIAQSLLAKDVRHWTRRCPLEHVLQEAVPDRLLQVHDYLISVVHDVEAPFDVALPEPFVQFIDLFDRRAQPPRYW